MLGEVERVRQIRYANSILSRELPRLAAMTPNTGRNRATFLLTCRVGRWFHAGILSGHEVVSAIVATAVANGLVKDDGLPSVHATIASGFAASARDQLPNLGTTGRGAKS